jgi:hypothetical protein
MTRGVLIGFGRAFHGKSEPTQYPDAHRRSFRLMAPEWPQLGSVFEKLALIFKKS